MVSDIGNSIHTTKIMVYHNSRNGTCYLNLKGDMGYPKNLLKTRQCLLMDLPTTVSKLSSEVEKYERQQAILASDDKSIEFICTGCEIAFSKASAKIKTINNTFDGSHYTICCPGCGTHHNVEHCPRP